MPITFTDLPYDLFIDHLFPFLPTSSLLALKRTCKLFAEAGSDSVFWKRRLQTDYNFPTSGDTARTNGFDVLYKGMRKPRVYMWGTSTFGRLGLDEELLDDSYGVPIPTELKFESRIVSLTSGGW
ncbi:hypothetical protein FRC03_007944 [Tulasnella sp. 419]|nr:hypothetical protein FRC03_007944 [Tulasnella sp. 419]